MPMKITNSFIAACAICCSFNSCTMSHHLVAVTTNDAPKPVGPYSQAIKSGKQVFCSGQIGLLPETGAMAGDDITMQTRQALKNLAAVLAASGSDMAHVLKVTIYMKDLADFGKVNDIYKDYFSVTKPARSTVQVAALPKGALIEIECIAVAK